MYLYSYRWTTAKGWHWVSERYCEIENAKDWLEYFSKQEPDIHFKLGKQKPKPYQKESPKNVNF